MCANPISEFSGNRRPKDMTKEKPNERTPEEAVQEQVKAKLTIII